MLRLLVFALTLAIGYLPYAISSSLAIAAGEDRPVGSLGGAVHADPFTGVATTSLPIEVPPGRNGMQPSLALTYSSAAGNGWLGMGWDLEQEGIYRQTKWGVDYANNDGAKAFMVKMAGVGGDLVPTPAPAPSTQWSTKVEGGFSRIEKLTAVDGQIMWKVTTKQGRKHYFGQTAASRQVDPANASRIFGWLLDRVEDLDGNYMTYWYWPDTANNQVYLDHIDYAGNGATAPTNAVKFWLDDGSRPDQSDMYSTNYRVKTKYRLKTIQLGVNGVSVRAYRMDHSISLNANTTLLSGMLQFGKDVTIDGSGTLTGGTPLPSILLSWQGNGESGTFPTAYNWVSPNGYGNNYVSQLGDFNGDGKLDIYLFASSSGSHVSWVNIGPMPDLLISISNGLGGATTITYAPSTTWSNIRANLSWLRGLRGPAPAQSGHSRCSSPADAGPTAPIARPLSAERNGVVAHSHGVSNLWVSISPDCRLLGPACGHDQSAVEAGRAVNYMIARPDPQGRS